MIIRRQRILLVCLTPTPCNLNFMRIGFIWDWTRDRDRQCITWPHGCIPNCLVSSFTVVPTLLGLSSNYFTASFGAFAISPWIQTPEEDCCTWTLLIFPFFVYDIGTLASLTSVYLIRSVWTCDNFSWSCYTVHKRPSPFTDKASISYPSTFMI